jgi:hypothetical protein
MEEEEEKKNGIVRWKVETHEEGRTRKRLRRNKKRMCKRMRMKGIICTRKEEGKIKMDKKKTENQGKKMEKIKLEK